MSAPTGAGEPAMCAATPSLVGRSSPRGRATDMEFFGRDLEVTQGVVGSLRTAQSHAQDAGGSGPILEGLIPQIIAGCTELVNNGSPDACTFVARVKTECSQWALGDRAEGKAPSVSESPWSRLSNELGRLPGVAEALSRLDD